MSKRLLTWMLTGAVAFTGLAIAQDPPANDEPPVRLKKRKPREEEKSKADPDNPVEKRQGSKNSEKKDEPKAEPREAEPVTPQEEEKEVLQRVITNVHRVGEQLAKNDLGEATQQTQRDILKDLESLIHRNENSPPQGGAGQDQNQGGGSENQNNNDQQGGGGQQGGGQKSQSQAKGGQRSQGQSKGGQNSQGGSRTGTKPGGRQKSGGQQQQGGKSGEDKRAGQDAKSGEKPGGKNGKNGNGGGGGNRDDRYKNADLDKQGVWGHLPQTLRPQMDAYSNPQPFMPKYDDLIKRYYRTISEQGRRKGE